MEPISTQKILILVNPISGGYSKKELIRRIGNQLDRRFIDFEITETVSAEQMQFLASEAVSQNLNAVVAVGGDGTVRLVAKELIGSNTALGIIPAGSGNGYARSLAIPTNLHRAVEIIKNNKITRIDTGLLNGEAFINVAGAGFDAHVASYFQSSSKRGFLTYTRIVLSEYLNYSPSLYKVITDTEEFEDEAFLISVCIGSDYGNKAQIAPLADIKDGLFDIVLIRKAEVRHIPAIIWKLFNGTIRSSDNIQIIRTPHLKIIRKEGGFVHLDGDPFYMNNELEFTLRHLSLSVLAYF